MSAGATVRNSDAAGTVMPVKRDASQLRVWFPIALVAAYWGFIYVNQNFGFSAAGRFISRMIVLLLFVLIYTVWWLTRSAISWRNRFLAIVVIFAISTVAVLVADKSMSAFGFFLSAGPLILTASTIWLLLTKQADPFIRRGGFVALMILVCGYFTLTRFDGLYTNQSGEIHWRWTPTSEQTFLKELSTNVRPAAFAAGKQRAWTLSAGDSPEYRGLQRDGVVRGVSLATDWNEHPPKLLWTKKVGPAWSGMILVDGNLVTQEQRGDKEAVTCYDAETGDEIWVHEDPVRFEENLSGAGPRATPTFVDGRIYTYGGKGTLNSLKAESGEVVWSHDCPADAEVAQGDRPQWGYSASPLVVDGLVIVFAGGGDKSVLAYHADDGKLAWTRAGGKQSYSSAQLVTLQDTKQIVMHDNRALMGLNIADGVVLWELPGTSEFSLPMLQPHVVGAANLVFSTEPQLGMVEIKREGEKWSASDTWNNNKLRSGFNDFVIHDGCVFALDDGVLCCIDLADGHRLWKKGRLDHGQILLLADQKLLLLLLEKGDAVLVSADRGGFNELGRFKALQGKTWNSPVLVGNRFYARNGEEMVAYDVSPKSQATTEK
jgi:outer membrane protein assembly factor BamB